MVLLTAGYWQPTYWPSSFWDDDYWLDYAVNIGITQTLSDTGIVSQILGDS